MNIEELKDKLENNSKLPNILIFKCDSEDSDFIFYQYIHKYSDNIGYNNIKYIESLSELNITSLFSDSISDSIYIYDIKKLEESLDDINDIVWVKCKSIPKKVKDKYSDYIIELPRLESWQVKDFIDTRLKDLNQEYKDKLYNNYKSNLFRLDIEMQKLLLYNDNINSNYEKIENQLYIDSSEYDIFDLSNCILKRDIESLQNLDISILDIDPFGFIKILLDNFRYVIDIQLSINSSPEYVGVSSKRFWAIKNNSCGYYSKEELVHIYQFLLTLDSKIKSGYINSSIVIDYIICKIMLLGR